MNSKQLFVLVLAGLCLLEDISCFKLKYYPEEKEYVSKKLILAKDMKSLKKLVPMVAGVIAGGALGVGKLLLKESLKPRKIVKVVKVKKILKKKLEPEYIVKPQKKVYIEERIEPKYVVKPQKKVYFEERIEPQYVVKPEKKIEIIKAAPMKKIILKKNIKLPALFLKKVWPVFKGGLFRKELVISKGKNLGWGHGLDNSWGSSWDDAWK